MYGNDLSDVDATIENPPPSCLTWPALIAKDLDVTYECHAAGGCGNLRILEQVLTQAVIEDDSIFIIGWTWIDRFDYIDSENKWYTVLPSQNSSQARSYYSNFHSEYNDKLRNLVYVQTALDTLLRKKVPFLMTCLDDLLLDQKWQNTLALRHMQIHVQKYIKTFDNLNFLDWSRSRNYPESAAWHPLEQAHRAAADYMTNEIKALRR